MRRERLVDTLTAWYPYDGYFHVADYVSVHGSRKINEYSQFLIRLGYSTTVSATVVDLSAMYLRYSKGEPIKDKLLTSLALVKTLGFQAKL